MEDFKRFLKIFGPIIGIILLYFVVRNAVFQFQDDAEHLSKVSPATMEEVLQDPSVFDALEEPMGEEAAEDEAQAEADADEEEQAVEDEAAENVAVEEMEDASEAADEELAEAEADEVAGEDAEAEEAAADAEESVDAVDSDAEEATEAEAEGADEEAAVEGDAADVEEDVDAVDSDAEEATETGAEAAEEEAATDDEAADDAVSPLVVAGHHWLLQNANDSDGEYSAMFDDGRLNGATVCSNYAGKYQADGETLAVAISATSPLTDAAEACADGDAAEEEEAFLAALQSAATFAVDGEQLEISDEEGNVVLVFESVASE